ncbi:N-acetylglucosamine-specific PTS transporter subunit IIBC [Erysipelothrix rhusiopathiae]|uniref:N-acetylglucosamine-specific PTS transporter subunit IIBC n=1 Tax=Erysipelothrix rhusiopathiae TaxID=1648 RepID=UPI000F42FDAD|nr:N-acetylglucosamine-specific PTS transporter subunit IIBC [Erysipelothrix rhusiopathiae]AYV34121.1 PTS glucose transporter subunit IIBC [Erysipelothrix rhusiopathiae]MDE8328950.1 N-acetylglucosamine-specific PTS transporter subunit IIBC [Erysipelothrix rhusiopathiae]
MMKHLQKLGRALMLPVAVLPAASLLMGIGYWIDPVGWGANSVLAAFLIGSGKAIIDKLPIIFAVGIAYGLSNDKDGAASLSGLVGFLMITTLLSVGSVANLKGIAPEAVNAAFGKIDNAFIGIISGVVGALMYNKFSKTELPTALAFFSGKRLAPIMTAVVMMPISIALLYIWPIVYGGLVSFGTAISSMGPLGAGLFGFFNRLLIPTGLHHALNSVFWFDTIGINDIGNFWGGTGVKGITGMYQAGFFPVMMFGLCGAGLAMYQSAKPENKKVVGSLMLAAGFSAFFTGVTEPIEFSFMFVAPALYLVHAILTGLSLFIVSSFGWTAGFGFSAGFVDLFLSSRLPLANKPYMIVVFGVVYFVIYYVLFRFLIVKFNIKTPGREEVLIDDSVLTSSDSKFAHQAEIILNALGGKENVKSVDYCTTRLRLELFETENIDEKAIKGTGAAGIVRPGGSSLQVIVGTNVQFVADEFKNLIK